MKDDDAPELELHTASTIEGPEDPEDAPDDAPEEGAPSPDEGDEGTEE